MKELSLFILCCCLSGIGVLAQDDTPGSKAQLAFAGRSWEAWAEQLRQSAEVGKQKEALLAVGTMCQWLRGTTINAMRKDSAYPDEFTADSLLLPFTLDKPVELRRLAVAALGYRRSGSEITRSTTARLFKLLTDTDDIVRANALDSLSVMARWWSGFAEGKERRHGIAATAKDSSVAVRRRLAAQLNWLLRQWPQPEAAAVLGILINDADPLVANRTWGHAYQLREAFALLRPQLLALMQSDDCTMPRQVYAAAFSNRLPGKQEMAAVAKAIQVHERAIGHRAVSDLMHAGTYGMQHMATIVRGTFRDHHFLRDLSRQFTHQVYANADVCTEVLLWRLQQPADKGQQPINWYACVGAVIQDVQQLSTLLRQADDAALVSWLSALTARKAPMPAGLFPVLKELFQRQPQVSDFVQQRGGWPAMVLRLACTLPEAAAKDWCYKQLELLPEHPDLIKTLLRHAGPAPDKWRAWLSKQIPTLSRHERGRAYALLARSASANQLMAMLQDADDAIARAARDAHLAGCHLFDPQVAAMVDRVMTNPDGGRHLWSYGFSSNLRLPQALRLACGEGPEQFRANGWHRLRSRVPHEAALMAPFFTKLQQSARIDKEREFVSTLQKHLVHLGLMPDSDGETK